MELHKVIAYRISLIVVFQLYYIYANNALYMYTGQHGHIRRQWHADQNRKTRVMDAAYSLAFVNFVPLAMRMFV